MSLSSTCNGLHSYALSVFIYNFSLLQPTWLLETEKKNTILFKCIFTWEKSSIKQFEKKAFHSLSSNTLRSTSCRKLLCLISKFFLKSIFLFLTAKLLKWWSILVSCSLMTLLLLLQPEGNITKLSVWKIQWFYLAVIFFLISADCQLNEYLLEILFPRFWVTIISWFFSLPFILSLFLFYF